MSLLLTIVHVIISAVVVIMSAITRDVNKKEERISSREKVHSAEKIKYIKSLLKLKQQESLMEKHLVNLTEKMKLEPEVLRLLLHNMSDVSRKRQISLDSIRKSLDDITEELRSVKFVMNHPEEIQKLDIKAYKQRLVRVSQKFRDFKESCQLESLSQEQTALESELREFQLNLHKYGNVTDNVNKPISTASSNKENKECHDYKQIQDIHALIAKTGRTGNWTDQDHLMFLRMREKCNNIPALVAAIQVKCPDLSTETIINHEAWYKMYLNLREKQRSSISEWRKQKELEKVRKEHDDETKTEGLLTEISREKTNFNITEKYPNCTTDKREMKAMKAADTVDINAARKKELIKRWKIEKQNKRSMDEQQSKIRMESTLAAQEKRKKERLKRIQEALAEYRRKKSMEVSFEVSKDNSREDRKYDPMLIEAFRKQDEEYTRRKRSLILSVRKPTKNQTTRIVRRQMTKMQDYSTLFNSTKVWRERCRIQNYETKESKELQYIKDLPRLCVRWRNEESSDIKNTLTFS